MIFTYNNRVIFTLILCRPIINDIIIPRKQNQLSRNIAADQPVKAKKKDFETRVYFNEFSTHK